jgi:MFS superfamily sulfate permease-like transporter
VLAGVTLAALSIPQALGYARIAGMPVVTGLYTLILPMAVFAVLGSSRHLVVAADSATAAILFAALISLAPPGSVRYVQLAGLAALLAGGLLLLARLARLGFLAAFLSRTVLLGFLTGVGIRVAVDQLPDMLGVTATGTRTLGRLVSTAAAVPHAHAEAVAVSAVVFLIGVGLIDVSGMRRILSVRRSEFFIALLTAAAVVVLGVEQGIVLAVVASIIDHLRHTYRPRDSVLVKSPAGHWHATPVRPGARTEKGLVVYRFGTDLYYANAARLQEDVTALTGHGEPLLWLVLDGAAIGDVDYTAALVLTEVVDELRERHIRFVVSSMIGPVRRQLDRYGISAAMGQDAYYDTPGAALEAFHAGRPPGGTADTTQSRDPRES